MALGGLLFDYDWVVIDGLNLFTKDTLRSSTMHMGILCEPDHPALRNFPTEYHSNWQWWDAMTYSSAICLNDFSTEVKPVVRVIDDWLTNRRL